MDFTQWKDLASILTGTFSINWPYGVEGIFLKVGKGETMLNPAFVSHVREVSNWTAGQHLVDCFPFLQGAVNIGA